MLYAGDLLLQLAFDPFKILINILHLFHPREGDCQCYARRSLAFEVSEILYSIVA